MLNHTLLTKSIAKKKLHLNRFTSKISRFVNRKSRKFRRVFKEIESAKEIITDDLAATALTGVKELYV